MQELVNTILITFGIAIGCVLVLFVFAVLGTVMASRRERERHDEILRREYESQNKRKKDKEAV